MSNKDSKRDSNKNSKKDSKKTSTRIKIKRIFIALIVICAVAGLGALVLNFIVIGSTRSRVITSDEAAKLKDVDCILVLGCGVYADGSLSSMLSDRLILASEVYNKGASDKLLMSGDHGTKYYNEVKAMKNYAVENKVAASSDVFMDHAGFSTYESIYRAKEVFGAKKIVILTNTYHLYRALYIADKLGIEAYGVGVADTYIGSSYRSCREILARDKDFVKCIFKPKPTFLGDKIDIHGDGDITND